MSEQKELVIVNSRGLDDERSSVAWSIANTAAASDMLVTVFLVAAGVEILRKREDTIMHPQSNCDDSADGVLMSKLSIWAQVPQFILIGIAEILVSISSYELFYSEVPIEMRSVCQVLNLLTTSLGSMITGGINSIFASWLPDNLDDGHLEYVYFFIAGLAAVGYLGLRCVSSTFVYKTESGEPLDEESLVASGFSPPLGRASHSRAHYSRRFSATHRKRRSSVPAMSPVARVMENVESPFRESGIDSVSSTMQRRRNSN